jgi:hypothetical protein
MPLSDSQSASRCGHTLRVAIFERYPVLKLWPPWAKIWASTEGFRVAVRLEHLYRWTGAACIIIRRANNAGGASDATVVGIPSGPG